MMLDDPAPGCQLPARVKVRDGSQAGAEGIDQGNAGKNKEEAPFESSIFPSSRTCLVSVHS